MTETHVRNRYRYNLQKLQKTAEHTNFLQQCIQLELLPNFTRIASKTAHHLNLNFIDIKKIRERNLEKALHEQNVNFSNLSDKLNILHFELKSFMTDIEIVQITQIFKNQISTIEDQNDKRRALKLEKLKNKKFQNNNFENYEKIEIFNYSDKIIPAHILKTLELGPDSAIGGVPNKTTILAKFELFFTSWSKHAVENGLDLIKITEIKALLFLQFLEFTHCISDTKNIKTLKKFLKENPDLIICLIDKSKNLGIFPKTEYLKKLADVYEPSKFEQIKDNPIKSDLLKLKLVISEFSQYLSQSDKRLLDPTEHTKLAYGLVKLHRSEAPLRPIISGRNFLTSGCEQYLLNLIQPILSECQYSVSSTKKFKEKFCAISDQFNPRIHEVISYDASQLFTSINVKRTVTYIVRQIYRDTQTFFPITDETPIPPPKHLMEQLFLDVLLKYNSFETLNGFYRQRMGVAMGGKLS